MDTTDVVEDMNWMASDLERVQQQIEFGDSSSSDEEDYSSSSPPAAAITAIMQTQAVEVKSIGLKVLQESSDDDSSSEVSSSLGSQAGTQSLRRHVSWSQSFPDVVEEIDDTWLRAQNHELNLTDETESEWKGEFTFVQGADTQLGFMEVCWNSAQLTTQ